MVRVALPPLSPFVITELSLSKTEVGLLVSSGALGYSVFQIPAGYLIDRFGVRRMLVASTFAAGAIISAMILASSFPFAVAVLFLGGFGYGCFPAVATKALLAWFPPNERGTAVGIQQTSINAAGIITASVLPLIAVAFGWRVGFVAVGIVSMAVSGVVLVFYRDHPSMINPRTTSNRHTSWTEIREVLTNRNILLVSFGCVGFMAVDYSMVTYLVVFLTDHVGMGVALAGLFLAVCNLGGFAGKLFFGVVSDRVFHSRRKPLLIAGCMMLAVSVITQLVGPETPGWVIALIFAAFGFSAIGWGGQNLVLVSESSRRETAGLAMGYSLMILLVGNIAGPPIFGYLVDTTGSYSPAWWFLTACSVAAVAIMYFVREKQAD